MLRIIRRRQVEWAFRSTAPIGSRPSGILDARPPKNEGLAQPRGHMTRLAPAFTTAGTIAPLPEIGPALLGAPCLAAFARHGRNHNSRCSSVTDIPGPFL